MKQPDFRVGEYFRSHTRRLSRITRSNDSATFINFTHTHASYQTICLESPRIKFQGKLFLVQLFVDFRAQYVET